MTEQNNEVEAPPALDDLPENPDEFAGEEVEGDFDPNEDYEPEEDE